MAYYLVKAKPKKDLLKKLETMLKSKAFVDLKPFGRALTFSLENARILEDGYSIWEEEDYCNPPLAEERASVLDKYFEQIDTKKINKGEGWETIKSLDKLFPNLH
jgi:hypothetical protein